MEYQTVEQVLNSRLPENGKFKIVVWADGKKGKPVFQQWTPKGPIEKPRESTPWFHHASDWARRTCFAVIFGLHSARRKALINGLDEIVLQPIDLGFANLALDNGSALGQVLKFASQHNTHVLVNHYLVHVSSVDGAASYLDME